MKPRYLQICALYWHLRSCKLQPKYFSQLSIRASLCLLSLPREKGGKLNKTDWGFFREKHSHLSCLVSILLLQLSCLMRSWMATKASSEVGMAQQDVAGGRTRTCCRKKKMWYCSVITLHPSSCLSHLFLQKVRATMLLMCICQIWLTGSKQILWDPKPIQIVWKHS